MGAVSPLLPTLNVLSPSLSALMAGPFYGAALQAAAAAAVAASSGSPSPNIFNSASQVVPFALTNSKKPSMNLDHCLASQSLKNDQPFVHSTSPLHCSNFAASSSSVAAAAVAAAAAAVALSQSSSSTAAAFHSELIKAASNLLI